MLFVSKKHANKQSSTDTHRGRTRRYAREAFLCFTAVRVASFSVDRSDGGAVYVKGKEEGGWGK